MSLIVSQPRSACSYCRARKVKCDGVAPSCKACLKQGRAASCSLRKDNLGTDRDYVAFLERKLRALQEQSQLSSSGVSPAGQAPHYAADGGQEPSNAAMRVDRLISQIGTLPILAASPGDRSVDGPSLATLMLAAGGYPGLETLNQESSPVTGDRGLHHLPKKVIADKLVSNYLTNVYPRMPFFSIQGLQAQVSLAYDENASSSHAQEGQAAIGDPSGRDYALFTVLMVLAISTSTFSKSSESLASHNANRFFLSALRYKEAALIPYTIAGFQAKMFVIQYATLNPSVLDLWYLNGIGMKGIIDLGLHQDPERPVPADLLETRRRLFWSMYSFDRSVSLASGRPFEVLDQIIRVELPEFRIDTSFSEIEILGYLQRYRILRFQSEVYNQYHNPMSQIAPTLEIHQLRNSLEEWNRVNDPMMDKATLVLLESEYQYAKQLLYRPCYVLPQREVGDLFELWQASLEFIRIYRQLMDKNEIFYAEVACQKIYMSGLTILYVWWQLNYVLSSNLSYHGRTQLSELLDGTRNVTFMTRFSANRWRAGEVFAVRFEQICAIMLRIFTSESLGVESRIEILTSEIPEEISRLGEPNSSQRIFAAASTHASEHHDQPSPENGEDLMLDLFRELG